MIDLQTVQDSHHKTEVQDEDYIRSKYNIAVTLKKVKKQFSLVCCNQNSLPYHLI